MLIRADIRAHSTGVATDWRAGAVRLCQGALNSVQQMIQLARKANVPVLIDPKGSDFERYRGATLLTPNLSEFEAVVGRCKMKKSWLAAVCNWWQISNFQHCW